MMPLVFLSTPRFLPPLPSLPSLSTNTPLCLSQTQNDTVSHTPTPRYDFTPLLTYLNSTSLDPTTTSYGPHTSLDSAEFTLAESYRSVPTHSWHTLLRSLSSSPSTFTTAHTLVTWLQRHNLCFSYELLYSILVHKLGQQQKLYEAFLLAHTHKLNPFTYNALIGACARNKDMQRALQLIQRMRQDGYPTDMGNYSVILREIAGMKGGGGDGVLWKMWEEIESEFLEMDAKVMNEWVVGWVRVGEVDRAMGVLEGMQGKGLSAKADTLVEVIVGLGREGRAEEAEAVLEEWKEGGGGGGGRRMRTRAYNAVVRGYGKEGRWREAERVVAEMEREGVETDEKTYCGLMEAYGKAGRWESARIVLKEMEGKGKGGLDAFVFSRMVAGYRDRGEWQRVFQVVREMRKWGVKPDRYFYNVMMDALGKYNCVELAVETFERMREEGVEPDVCTWNTLIDCHCKGGRYERAEGLFEEMKESGCVPCVTTYNIMVNVFGEQEKWEEVRGVMREMEGQGVLPNVVTYTTLVDKYGQSGRFKEAMECIEVMKAEGLKPSETMYNALINAYAQRVRILYSPRPYVKLLLFDYRDEKINDAYVCV